jgi:signal transduction histidine kinase
VENALQHSDRETPTVEVTATPTLRAQRNTLAVRVHDDGPGIPERERAVLTDEREITQLDHSRGLGLWLARWATQGLGGRLSFEEGGDGATVVLEVPVTGGNAPEETERGEAGN